MNARTLLPRLLPVLRWRHLVTRESLPRDLAAGLIGALIVLPQGIAFATLAGLPPEYGLYAAMVPTAVAALFGSSLHTVSGPTNAISIMTFASLAPLAVPGSHEYVQLAGTLAFLVRDEPVLVPDEIYIAYGIFISRGLTVDAKQPVNVFGQIEDRLGELAEVGRRILMNGSEMVRFSRGKD